MSAVSITKCPLQPKVTITKNDASTYVFDPFTPSFDFRLRRLQCSPPFDATGGTFSMTLVGNSATAANTNTILSNISEGNEVLIGIGKTSATNVFRGVIETIAIRESAVNYMELEISGPDWGSDILKHRVVNGAWIQKTDSSGNLDNTDNAVLISQIVSDLITTTFPYPASDIDAEAQGVVYSSSNVVVPTLRLPQFYANMEFLDDKLQELDAIGSTIHYVDVSKNFIMRSPTSASAASNVIIVDSYSDATALTWDQTKVGLIGRESTYTKTVENHKRRLFGLGGDQRATDQSQTTDSASTTLNAAYLAMRFTPIKGWGQVRCESIGVKVSKVGTPGADLVLELHEDSGSTAPNNTPVRTVTKAQNSISTTAEWHYFPIGYELNTKQNYWIVLRKVGADASNTYKWHHDNLDVSTSSTSADGVTWTQTTTPNRFGYTFIERVSLPLLTIYPYTVTASDKHFHEDVIRKPDITQSEILQFFIQSEFETLSKRKEIYKCKIYAPDTLLQTGQTVRIKKSSSAYSVDADDFVIGVLTYIFESTDDRSTGTFWYDLEATRFSTYS